MDAESEKEEEETPFQALERAKAENKRAQDIRTFLLKTLYYCTIPLEKRRMSYRIIENPRNERGCYNANCSITGSVTFPGATQLSVHFDDRTHTELRRDVLSVYSSAALVDDDLIEIAGSGGKISHSRFSGPRAEFTNFDHRSDRLWYQFTADEARNYWGFRATVTATYPSINNDSSKMVQQLSSPDVFQLISSLLASSSKTEQTFAGMALANLLGSDQSRQQSIRAHGDDWVKALLSTPSADVQTSVVLNLFKTDATTGQLVTTDALVQMVQKQGLASQFVGLLLSEDMELQGLALRVLQASLGLEVMSIEAVLLACIDNDAIRQQALDRLSAAVADPSGRQAILKLHAVQKIKPLVLLPDLRLANQAASTLINLLQTESAVDDFLRGFDGLHGAEILQNLLRSGNQERVQIALRLITTLVEKKLSDFGTGGRQVSESTEFEGSVQGRDFIQVVGASARLTSDMRPLYAALNKPVVGDDKRRQRKQQAAGKILNTAQTSISFWTLLAGVPDADGVPLFYKGCPNYEIVNRTSARITVRAEACVRRGRVYYEATALSSGAVNVSTGSLSSNRD